ncbi:MAG: hypothetical protein ACLPWF_32105 [Bryobacteraceae bacterium]
MPNKLLCVLIMAATASAHAQWLNYPSPGTPRTPDGRPNLTAPAPRAAHGKPDLSGVWQVEPTPVEEMKRLFGDLSADQALGDTSAAFSKYLVNILADVKPEDSPLRPEFVEILRQRSKVETPLLHCLPIGIPADDLLPGPFKIIQNPGLIVIRNEYENTFRQVYTDGRKPPADLEPLWLGYSVGKWEGDTLAVDTVGFNDKTWLDGIGHPHSEALRVTERFRRRDFGHMDVEVTIDDPKAYTKSFSVKFTELLQPDSDVTEYFCSENEKDRSHTK